MGVVVGRKTIAPIAITKGHTMPERLYMVIPCYNEEEVLPETAKRLKEKLEGLIQKGRIASNSRILFVDDGSRDNTWSMIADLHRQDKLFSGVKLSRNRGHQNALLCGLMTAKDLCDITISMDADLQDDIHVIDGFLHEREKGCDVVYGVRSDRESDSFFKRATAQGFYKGMKALGVDVVYNHADCRLMSRRALEGLAQFPEKNLFLRGMVPLIGYPSAIVSYKRAERFAGESKYPLKKMLSFAWDGVTSFSVKPLQLLGTVGMVITALSLLFSLYSLLAHLLNWSFRGWSALMGSLWLIAGVLLMAQGLTGAYIGKIYAEVKDRPRYLTETLLDE
jgi:glycosyltransferase involved in cell wall biosynthesis